MWCIRYFKKHRGKDRYVVCGALPRLTTDLREADGFPSKRDAMLEIVNLPIVLAAVCDPVRVRRPKAPGVK